MSLVPFFGEFGVIPTPLEMSLNYCSHGCAYCFANLNVPDRTANVGPILNLLRDFPNRSTLVAQLLQRQYPIAFSNKVDPLANSNDAQAMTLLKLATDMGVPIAMQTKGGRRWREALDILPPSVWYISISFDDEDMARAVEPGAPTIAHRLALVEAVRAAGGFPLVAINPATPEFLPDGPQHIVQRIRDAGALGVWTEPLHLNDEQQSRMSPRELAVVGPEIRERMGKQTSMIDLAFLDEVRDAVLAAGLEVQSNGQDVESAFFDVSYRAAYEHTFPVTQDFVNHAFRHCQPNQVLTFEDYYEVMAPRLPLDIEVGPDYLFVNVRDIKRDHNVPRKLSWAQTLAVIFKDARFKMCPGRSRLFAFAAVDTGKTDKQGRPILARLEDERGLPFYVFTPEGTEAYDVAVDPASLGLSMDDLTVTVD